MINIDKLKQLSKGKLIAAGVCTSLVLGSVGYVGYYYQKGYDILYEEYTIGNAVNCNIANSFFSGQRAEYAAKKAADVQWKKFEEYVAKDKREYTWYQNVRLQAQLSGTKSALYDFYDECFGVE